MKKKICFVVQRYGLEVNGGAELHCRQVAQHLTEKYDVDVATTKALDYISWKDYYKDNKEVINGVTVHRFSVESERDIKQFSDACIKLSGGFYNTEAEEMEWVKKQGPNSPDLIQYLVDNKDNYDAFIFYTYLYYQTVVGVNEVADKAIVIPTAHDEPFLGMKVMHNVFTKPKAIIYLTESEKKLVNIRFNNEAIKSEIIGVGIDIPDNCDSEVAKKKYNLDKYLIYVGRIDEGKSCDKLFKYFIEYKKRYNNDIKLVLCGKAVIDVPEEDDIIKLGFISDEDKFNLVKGAISLIMPSEFESLSMVVLEAMALKTPVIVNGECDVLKAHCRNSNAGLYYYNYNEFERCIQFIVDGRYAKIMGENGYEYVNSNYKWNVLVDKIGRTIEYVCND